jgi:hypothetical protein
MTTATKIAAYHLRMSEPAECWSLATKVQHRDFHLIAALLLIAAYGSRRVRRQAAALLAQMEGRR